MAADILRRCLPPDRLQADAEAIKRDVQAMLDTETLDDEKTNKLTLARQTKLLDATFMRMLSGGLGDNGYLRDAETLKIALLAQKYSRLASQSLHVMRTNTPQTVDENFAPSQLKDVKILNKNNVLKDYYYEHNTKTEH